MLYHCLVKITLKKTTIAALMMMMCVTVVGLRVPSFCCGYPWPPYRLSSLGQLLRTCSRAHSIPVGSPSPPSKKKKMLHAVCGADLKNKILVQGEFNPSLPRPSTASRPPPSSSNPASCRRSSLHANGDCAVAWLVVAPASAHEYPD